MAEDDLPVAPTAPANLQMIIRALQGGNRGQSGPGMAAAQQPPRPQMPLNTYQPPQTPLQLAQGIAAQARPPQITGPAPRTKLRTSPLLVINTGG